MVSKEEQETYDKYHAAQEKTYRDQIALENKKSQARFSNVVKLNFMGLFFGGVNLEYERKIAKKNAVVVGINLKMDILLLK